MNRARLERLGDLLRKAQRLVGTHGLLNAAAVVMSVVEDSYLRLFDRWYQVKTSGYIALNATTLSVDQQVRGHRYRPVNAWGFRAFLRGLRLEPGLAFVDLGAGLGRACLLAAQTGRFSRVRGVELVPEFCEAARQNALTFRSRGFTGQGIEIIESDALIYSRSCDDNVVFMFNPFPVSVLRSVAEELVRNANQSGRALCVIYSERIMETSRTLECLRDTPGLFFVRSSQGWGQSFHAFSTKMKTHTAEGQRGGRFG